MLRKVPPGGIQEELALEAIETPRSTFLRWQKIVQPDPDDQMKFLAQGVMFELVKSSVFQRFLVIFTSAPSSFHKPLIFKRFQTAQNGIQCPEL